MSDSALRSNGVHAQRLFRPSILAAAFSLVAATFAQAQVFSESFDAVGVDSANGPANLLTKGFEFRSVLDPGLTHSPWSQIVANPSPFEGTGSMRGGISVAPFGTYDYVKWILLPSIPGQSAGQIASFWVQGFTSPFPIANSVELRYSPSGGTTTGSTTAAVGDFTVALAGNSNASFSSWDHVQVTVPGSGRLAIRWSGTISGGFSGTFLDCLLDEFTLSQDGVTPILPQPGQTVHWTTASSPIHLTNQQIVPAGGTLVIDAGVSVYFDFTAPLFAGTEMRSDGGTIRLAGTAASPVVLRRGVNTTQVPRIGVGYEGGTIEADYVDSTISLSAGSNGRLVARHCTIHRDTPIDWESATDSQYHVPTLAIAKATGSLTNNTFTHAICSLRDSIARVEGNTFVDSLLYYDRFPIAQPAHIDGNTFSQSNERAPLALEGYDYHLGPQNVINGNAYPLDLFGAGLTKDSVVPATGNATNKVRFFGSTSGEIKGPLTLPKIATSYLVPQTITAGDQYDPHITLLAGATLEMGPQVGFLFEGVARIDVRGTPEEPVRFERATPNAAWIGYTTASDPPVIVRNARFQGAQWSLGTTDSQFVALDCEFVSNLEGIRVGDLGLAYVSRCRFLDNAVGVNIPWAGISGIDLGRVCEFGAGNANSFEGTGQGIVVDPTQLDPYSMQDAWWGHPSGPHHPSNPGGAGQAVVGDVDVIPFRTMPVEFSDHPPVVDVVQVSKARLLEPGSKILLSWSATDDQKIVAQRLEYRGVGGYAQSVIAIPSIPPLARNVELVVPDTASNPPSGWPGDLGTAVFRIVAVDENGQEGFDDFNWSLALDQALPVSFTTDLSSGYEVGETFDLATTLSVTANFTLFIDDLPHDVQYLGAGVGTLPANFNTMPAVSTDRARYAVDWFGEPHYSPYFSIRPNDSLGDLPPTLALTSPAAGVDFAGGTVVPITWSASDDHSLRSFDLQACYDGVTWHPFVEGLAGSTTQYSWQLPQSTGISDVRIRVIARDSRFQVTSAETAAFDILPGGSPWFDLGYGVAGSAGIPKLAGFGGLVPGSPVQLALTAAKPNSPSSFLFIGLASWNLPLLGGVLVPRPDIVLAPLPTNAAGAWTLPTTWPSGVPAGTQIYFQCWIPDPMAPHSAAASNGLGALAP